MEHLALWTAFRQVIARGSLAGLVDSSRFGIANAATVATTIISSGIVKPLPRDGE